MVEFKREVPKCTIFLVVGALTAHTLVLIGNLSTSHMLHGLGASSSGWSSVGTSLAEAMKKDLDPAMESVSSALTQGISVVTQIEEAVDVMLSMSGVATDSALAGINNSQLSAPQVAQTKAQLMQQLRTVTDRLVREVSAEIDKFLRTIQPALQQVQVWMSTFSESVQHRLEEFSSTLDRVQKILDSVMTQVSASAGEGEEDMLYNTYTLFDTDKSGTIQVDDIKSVASLYGITALEGNKAAELFQKYDADGKGGIDEEEYALFVNDPSIPGIMPLMLRTYSNKLATIAGSVAGARMRDEAATAVVEYLSLVCAKNMSKISWVSQALVNGSLPMEFTADVLKGLAVAQDNPNDLTLVQVGSVVTAEMLELNTGKLTQAVELLADPEFWASEGFDPDDQPVVVARVVTWLVASQAGANVAREALDLQGVSKSELAAAAQDWVASQQASYSAEELISKASSDEELYTTSTSKVLRSALLGGVGAAAQGDTKEADMAVNKGQPAMPVSLRFTAWLASNASLTAERHLQECFDYSGTSSGTLDSFANQLSGMIKKVQGFVNTMSKYATPKGIDLLSSQAQMFAQNATDDVLLVVEKHVDAEIELMRCLRQADTSGCTGTPVQMDIAMDLSGAFNFFTGTLLEFKRAMPPVIDDLKSARKTVTSVSNTIHTVMQVMGLKAPPMLYSISGLYKLLWVLYFVFFVLLTLAVLFYGFWASGFFCGPGPSMADESYEAPRTLGEKLRLVCCCCCSCFKATCCNGNLCFWSVILLFEVFVLLLFVIAVVICIVGGLQAFLSAGCSQVYILGDDQICTSAMLVMKEFLGSFWEGNVDDMCGSESLLTCKLIAQETVTAVKISIIGGLLSSVLSFQMIVESAIMHERVRWRLMFDAEAKKP